MSDELSVDRAGVVWSARKSPEFEALRSGETVVIVPIGSTEQHGPHLPVCVDTLLATEVAIRAAQRCRAAPRVLVAPAVPVSLAEHHMGFGGSLTLDYATFAALLRCLVGSIARQGFQRILLLNGHGGNIAALGPLVVELTRALDVALASASYWHLAAAEFDDILEGQASLQHACEAETSMMLALAPESVDMAAARGAAGHPERFPDPGGAYRYRGMHEWTATGIVGRPHLASRAKGERLLAAAVQALATQLQERLIWPEPIVPAGAGSVA